MIPYATDSVWNCEKAEATRRIWVKKMAARAMKADGGRYACDIRSYSWPVCQLPYFVQEMTD